MWRREGKLCYKLRFKTFLPQRPVTKILPLTTINSKHFYRVKILILKLKDPLWVKVVRLEDKIRQRSINSVDTE